MRSSLRRLIPSMFHRRLALLAIGMALLFLVISAKLAWLTLEPASAADRREKAEAVLQQRTFLPTVRGRIFDRQGRVLAYDRASYDVTVHYSVLNESWAYKRARRKAYLANRFAWREIDDQAKEKIVAEYLPEYEAQLDELWTTLARADNTTVDDILQRRAEIISRVLGMRTDRWMGQLDDMQDDDASALTAADIDVREQNLNHMVVHDLTDEPRLAIERILIEAEDDDDSVWSMVAVTDTKRRAYPFDTMRVRIDRSVFPRYLKNDEPVDVDVPGVAIHLLGSMRDVWGEDLERRPFFESDGAIDFGGYRLGDAVGAWGIEASAEDVLRGHRGESVKNRETGTESIQSPTHGHDVHLTIDIQLQARIEALMRPDAEKRIGLMRRQTWHEKELAGPVGEPLRGAAVVLEVATGEVLSAVSVPSFTREQLQDEPHAFWSETQQLIEKPRMYRPTSSLYAPGSTVKPLVLASAMSAGKLAPGGHIECKGHFLENNRTVMRCWIYKHYYPATHGSLDGPHAIEQSCNIFFYTLGQRLGNKRLVDWYAKFGLGEPTGCGIGESGGILPDPDELQPNDSIFMAIGQGPIAVTPIQSASAYATLARGGIAIPPTFIRRSDATPGGRDIKLARQGVSDALEGMYLSANEQQGTSHHVTFREDGRVYRDPVFTLDNVKVFAKSGTAQAVDLRIDSDGDGRITSRDRVVQKGDHAWVVALVQKPGDTGPRYVITVVVEYAGSGGKVAGPIVNQIMYAMRGEGYL